MANCDDLNNVLLGYNDTNVINDGELCCFMIYTDDEIRSLPTGGKRNLILS